MIPNKFTLYALAGVPCYLVIDQAMQREGKPLAIYGYELTPDQEYVRIPPDEHGRIWLHSIGLWVAPHDESIIFIDENGMPLESYRDLKQSREEERRAKEEERRAKEEERRAKEEERRAKEEEREKNAALQAQIAALQRQLQEYADAHGRTNGGSTNGQNHGTPDDSA